MKQHQQGNKRPRQSNADYVAGLKTTQATQKQRKSDKEEKQHTHTHAPTHSQYPFVKLFGLEETYNAYLRYRRISREAQGHYDYKTDSQQLAPQSTVDAAQAQKQQLEAELCAHGFNGITDFENQLQCYTVEFERETAEIALAHLGRYESQLQQQAERYSDPATVTDLHKGLGNFRNHQAATEKHQAERTAYNREQGLSVMTGTRTFDKTHADSATKEKQHRTAATEQLTANAHCHPILAQNAPSPRANLDRSQVASATTPEQLGEYLQTHIAARLQDIQQVRSDLAKNPALIYQMDSLLTAAYPLLGVAKGSIHEQLIQARKDKLESQQTFDLLFASVLAVALSVGSMGTGVPAALMGVGAFGISSHLAYEEYQHYEQQSAAGGSGLASQDPSIAWLVVSVLAAGLDLAVAAKAIKAIGPLAKSLEATGDLGAFEQGLRVLVEVGEIDGKIAAAAREAGEAKVLAREAQERLRILLAGRLQSGPVIDAEVYSELVRMAYNWNKSGMHSFKKFYLEFLKMQKLKGLKDLQNEDLAKLKNAFEEGRKKVGSDKTRTVEKRGDFGKITSNLKIKIPYGGSDLSKAVQNFRLSNNITGGQNVAIFEYLDDFGKVLTIINNSQRGIGHAERIIVKELSKRGVPFKKVMRIYSELEPCGNIPGGHCARFIQENFPQAKVTYSFQYGETKASRLFGVQTLKNAVQKLFK